MKCVLLFGFGMLLDDIFYKETNKNIHHSIASRIAYHTTHILTNNKHLKPDISLKFDQL